MISGDSQPKILFRVQNYNFSTKNLHDNRKSCTFAAAFDDVPHRVMMVAGIRKM